MLTQCFLDVFKHEWMVTQLAELNNCVHQSPRTTFALKQVSDRDTTRANARFCNRCTADVSFRAAIFLLFLSHFV